MFLRSSLAYFATNLWTCPKRILCFRASVLSSLGWQSGSWTLTRKQEPHLASWSARLHACMIGLRRGPEEDIGSFWMRIHGMGHQCMKKHDTSLVSTFRVQKTQHGRSLRTRRLAHCGRSAHCRDLSWRQQQQNWEVNGNKWSGVALSTRRLLEMGTRLRALGRDVCSENEDALNVGWKATAQLRP